MFRRFPLSRVFVIAALSCAALAARAMSVIPPTMDQLVAAADTIVRGVVMNVRAEEFDTPEGRGVRTLVTLRVERALKGAPGETVTLALLGGKVGRHSLRVVGMPEFKVGDRQIVFFANNGTAFCPLISAGHGRYHVRHDAAANRDFIARDNGAPLTSTDEIAAPLESAAPAVSNVERPAASVPSAAHALSAADFETRIVNTVSAQGRPRLQP